MKLTNREKIILPVALLIVFAIIFINFVYFPIDKDIKELKIQSEDLDTQNRELVIREKKIVTLQGQIKEAKESLQKNNNDIMKLWDQADLLAFIEDIIDKYAQKTSIDFFDVETVDVVQRGEINLVVKGTYDKLLMMFETFENAGYYNNITKLEIKEAEEDMDDTEENDKMLEADMNISFYSQNLNNGYPKKYGFIQGNYGKANIFE
jgi:hypothetical protein